MKRRINHGRIAGREARAAAWDITSIAFPKIGELRHAKSAVNHTQKAISHGQKAIKSEINRFRRNIGL
jgi:hypothetical protein